MDKNINGINDDKMFDEEITFTYTGDNEWNASLSNGYPLGVYMPLSKLMNLVENHLEELSQRRNLENIGDD